MENPLFGDATPEQITEIVETDWKRFSCAAYIALGRRDCWEAAVREYDLLSQLFFRDGLGDECLTPVLDLLIDRVHGCGDPITRLEYLSKVVFDGIEMPGLTYARRKAKALTEFMALPAAERARIRRQRQQEENRAWKDAYLAGELDTKPQAVHPKPPHGSTPKRHAPD